MASTQPPTRRRAARHAVRAMHRAVQALRQHGDRQELCRTALHRGTTAVLAATHQGPLCLHLGATEVAVLGEAVLHHAPGEEPFGALAAAGFGELVLARGLPAASVEALLRLLAATPSAADHDHDAAALLQGSDLEGVRIRAATSADDGADADLGNGQRAHWNRLPPPDARFRCLQPLVERSRDANLPAIAARLLLADLDDHGGPAPLCGDLLDALFAAMLQRGDAATAAWLLEQAQHHAAVPASTALQLRSRAKAAHHGPWLQEQLERGSADDPTGLFALAVQLGDEAVAHLADVAAGSQTLPDWLRDFLPPPR